jgi:MoxR-like ATPase
MGKSLIRSTAGDIKCEILKKIYGIDYVVQLCLVALFTKGHVLLEANPGLGKTELIKTMGLVMGLPWGRIQFTPDLMPADITGTELPEDGRFEFSEGPIFKTLLLADEINRASPKTQSAMLEAMAERQVTVLGKEHSLPAFFTVFATQNPIDHEGVYPLPEAQADRFMFKIRIYPPELEILAKIIDKEATKKEIDLVSLKVTENQLKNHRETILSSRCFDPVTLHIRNMFMASNLRTPAFHDFSMKGTGLGRKQSKWIKENADLFQFGLSPRAVKHITLATKAWHLMFAKAPDSLATAADLAHVVLPILRHRLRPRWDWEEDFQQDSSFAPIKSRDEQQRVDWLLKKFVYNTAPNQDNYRMILRQQWPAAYA